MGRQRGAGALASAPADRPQPHPPVLPVRFTAVDPTADDCVRHVEVDRERVLVRRTVRGVRMRFNVPMSSFLGVSVRTCASGAALRYAVTLEHRDDALSVPLYVGGAAQELIREWRRWAGLLNLRMLLADAGDPVGRTEIDTRSAALLAPTRRRLRRTLLRRRRATGHRRRATVRLAGEPVVHRGEREIIAPE